MNRHLLRSKSTSAKYLSWNWRVLRGIGEMGENACDLLALGRVADLVQLVKVNHRVHTLAIHQNLDNLAPRATFVGVGMTLQETAVRGAAQRNESKRAVQNLADAFLDQRGLARSHGSLDRNGGTDT